MASALMRTEEPQHQTIPSALSLPRGVVSALTASEYVVGQGSRWTPAAAHAAMSDLDRARLPAALAQTKAAMACDKHWLENRLTVLWISAGYRKGEAQATAWLGETVRLLGDIPTDIASAAIDEAVKRSQRGFIPAVGEIRALAEPAIEKRRQAIRRLEKLIGHEPEQPKDRDTEYCSADAAAAIIAEFGLSIGARASKPTGPLRMPTEADYAAMGITPEQLRASREAAQAEIAERATVTAPPRVEQGPPLGDDGLCPFCGSSCVDEIEGVLSCNHPEGCGASWRPDLACAGGSA